MPNMLTVISSFYRFIFLVVTYTALSKQALFCRDINEFPSIIATPTPSQHKRYNVTRENALSLCLTNSSIRYPIVGLREDATEPFHLY